MRGPLQTLFVVLSLPAVAWGQEELCHDVGTDQVEGILTDLEAALVAGRTYDAEFFVSELRERKVRCLNEVITPTLLGRYARDVALYHATFTADEVQGVRWGRVWQRVAPTLPWPANLPATFVPRRKVLRWLEDWGPGEPVVLSAQGWAPPKKSALFVDGELQQVLRFESETPHFVQVFDAKKAERLEGFFQNGAQADEAFLGEPSPQKPPKWFSPEDPAAAAGVLLAEGWLPPADDPYADWEPLDAVVIGPPVEPPPVAPEPPKAAPKPSPGPEPSPEPAPVEAPEVEDAVVEAPADPPPDTVPTTPEDGRVSVAVRVAEGPDRPERRTKGSRDKNPRALDAQRRASRGRGAALLATGGTSLLASGAMVVVAALTDPRTGSAYQPDAALQADEAAAWFAAGQRANALYWASAGLGATGAGLLTAGGVSLSYTPGTNQIGLRVRW